MFTNNSLLITSALLLSLTSTVAFADTSCNVNLSGGMKVDVNNVEFFTEVDEKNGEQQSLYKITTSDKNKTLLIDNQSITLNEAQQNLLNKYDTKIREIIPQVKNVAMESVDLAIDGVDLAFNDLLGDGNQLAVNLTKELTFVKSELAAHLSIEKGIAVGVKGLENESVFGEDIEQRVELAIKKAVVDSTGSILMAVGQQLMLSGNNGPSFDTRMKNFSDKIEQEVSIKTAKIEEKSQVLCQSISKIDLLEEQLKNNIKPLAATNVFTVTKG